MGIVLGESHPKGAPSMPSSGHPFPDRTVSRPGCASASPWRCAAQRCGIARSTAFRWRHRFLQGADLLPDRLHGPMEADETYLPRGRKDERNLDRPARRCGGKASKRGLSAEQMPIPMAVARGGPTAGAVLKREPHPRCRPR